MRRVTRKGLTVEDKRLWRHVAESVTPLPGRAPADLGDAEPPPAPPAPVAAPAEPKQSSPPDKPRHGPPAPPPLAPLERRERQRLNRGQREVQAVLDLHGHRETEAHFALHGFLARHHAEGAAIVLVITGKGETMGSGATRGVLRRLVPLWLAEPAMRRIVLGFENAGRRHGGEGALYVRLRRRKGQNPAEHR